MTIEKQLELEKNMIDNGARNFLISQREAEREGRGAETDYARRLMKEFMLPLVEAADAWMKKTTPGKQGRVRVLLRQASAETCMFIAIKCVFNSFMITQSVAGLANTIGRMIEDEQRFSRFAEVHKDYYDEIIRDFKRKGTKDYRFMHRVLTHKANEKQHGWIPWGTRERVDVGTKMLDLILTHTDLIEKSETYVRGRTVVELVPTQFALDWVKKHEQTRMFLYPERAPTIIPPDAWTDPHQGGYYSPALRALTPMIKTKLTRKQMQNLDLSRVMESMNIAQETAWKVNKKVLEIAKYVWARNLQIGMPASEKYTVPPCPVTGEKETWSAEQLEQFKEWKFEAATIYTADKERISKSFQVSRIIRMATQYSEQPAFWYVWTADSRGRIYAATSGFSPQGPDLAKGILHFRTGLPLGGRGLRQLKILGANRYGYDKDSYDGRVKWVDERHEAFVAAGKDPLAHTEVWSGADKPYQFLAFLMEYAALDDHVKSGASSESFVSHLSNGLDGSCNGLQNFSAMLRDAVGGKATNLVPGLRPNDIYGDVARVTQRRVQEALVKAQQYVPADLESQEEYAETQRTLLYAQKWLEFGIDRKVAKRPVMTLPYGSTRQSCTQYILQAILDKNKGYFGDGKAFKAAVWLTDHMWAAIGEVVVAATQAMQWLQQCATALNRVTKPIAWKTADGFVAYQHSTEYDSYQIDTQLAGRFQIRIGVPTNRLDKNKQRLGVAPNFVHSMDATHLRMTIRKARERGIMDLALIHDDYGTHCCNTHILHEVIREAFVELYGEHDPIKLFASIVEACGAKVPPMPKRGDLDLNAVLKSEYFFG